MLACEPECGCTLACSALTSFLARSIAMLLDKQRCDDRSPDRSRRGSCDRGRVRGGLRVLLLPRQLRHALSDQSHFGTHIPGRADPMVELLRWRRTAAGRHSKYFNVLS